VKDRLEVVGRGHRAIGLGLPKAVPGVDTHSSFAPRGKPLSPHLEATFLRLFREVGALGERLNSTARGGRVLVRRNGLVEDEEDCPEVPGFRALGGVRLEL